MGRVGAVSAMGKSAVAGTRERPEYMGGQRPGDGYVRWRRRRGRGWRWLLEQGLRLWRSRGRGRGRAPAIDLE